MELTLTAPMEKSVLRMVQRGCYKLGERVGNAFEDGALLKQGTMTL